MFDRQQYIVALLLKYIIEKYTFHELVFLFEDIYPKGFLFPEYSTVS